MCIPFNASQTECVSSRLGGDTRDIMTSTVHGHSVPREALMGVINFAPAAG